MNSETMPLNNQQTLAQRMSEGRLPVPEALRYAMQLAEQLRKLHETGKVHGAVTPAHVALAGAGVDLLPPAEGPAPGITPYTAPEVVQGRPADARSDIFGFGAILFEMLTGKRAFEGESRITLAASLTKSPTPASGSPAVDRLVGPCLQKNPDARTCRLQMILMELKLLSVAARRAETASGGAVRRETGETARADAQQWEVRLTERLQAHDRTLVKKVAEIERATSEAVNSLAMQVTAMSGELAANRRQEGDSPLAGLDEAASAAILTRVDRGFEALSARMAQIERTVEEIRHHSVQFENSVAADLLDIESTMKLQTAAIESARTAMSQTDDLVERVVEALESLQTAVLDQSEGPEQSAFAVN